MARPTSVLFVCLGNICRSPLAEGVFRHLVAERGLAEEFDIDSAGTGGWHVGEPADPRSQQVAEAHGIELTCRARRLDADDLERFEWILAMDRENLGAIRRLAAEADAAGARLHLLREFDPEAGTDLEVPDPYYGGEDGFETVYAMVHRACVGLLDELQAS
ncbi:MAG: low molecular weight protein-tyrosine-phosphatase [Gemmatimonadota bacterium]|nr:low molecular weight phosphotyrosine protein phosphatase [Gemmatimonadota bacterium]